MFFIHVIIKYHMSIEEKRVSDHLLLRFKYIREIKINDGEWKYWCDFSLWVHRNHPENSKTKERIIQKIGIVAHKLWSAVKSLILSLTNG